MTHANPLKILATLTALLCAYLFYLLCFTPHLFLLDLGIEGSESAYLVSRRAGMLMLGVSVLMFFSRNSPHSPARQAIILSIAVAMLGLAAASAYEFFRGFVGPAILGALITESILTISFFYLWFSYHNKSSSAYTTHSEESI